MKIAHLFPDSPFLSFTAEAFETTAPGTNTFLVYALRGDVARHGLPATARVETVVNDGPGLERVSAVVGESDIAIFHSVGAFGARALAAAPRDTLKVWSGWGGDYYGSSFSGATGLLGPQSARYHHASRTLPGRVQRTYRHVKSSLPLGAAARAADVFSAPIPNDLAVFQRRFPGFRGRYSQLNYASVEDTFASTAPVTGDDILLGNSATVQNNHFEALDLIARSGAAGRRVVVPLSYGEPAYADAVVAHGTALLGSDFLPLREFMPLEDYQQIVAACSVVVMAHRRQQGIGNVAAALWGGAHVFLDAKNPLSAFLRERGASVGTLGGLATSGLPEARMAADEWNENRRVLQDFWGRSTVLANIEALIASA